MDVEFPTLDEIGAMGPHREQDPLHPALLMGSEESFSFSAGWTGRAQERGGGGLAPYGGVWGAKPPKWREPKVIS